MNTLPAGLAIVSLDSVAASSTALTSSRGTWATVLSGATVGTNGSSATFNFGTVTNSDTDDATDTLTIQYEVVALNVSANTNQAVDNNSATFSFTGGSATASASATILTPHLKLTHTANK